MGIPIEREELDRFIKNNGKTVGGALTEEEFGQLYTYTKKALPSIEKVTQQFRVVDREGTGFISSIELKNLLTKFGKPLSTKEVDDMLNEVDPDNYGSIDYSELLRVISAN